MSFLFGSAPKASFSTQPTVNPAQEELLNVFTSFLGDPGFTQSRVANIGNQSLAALEQQSLALPTGATGQQTAARDTSFNTLQKALGYQAPKVSATSVTAPSVDSTAAFRTGVEQPLIDDFLSRTLPGIEGKYGGSAGGTYSSGGAEARSAAATDLERVLAQAGSSFTYDTSKLNAANALTAALANQGAGLTAGTANQSADINAQSRVLAALGLAPTVSTLPETTRAADIGLSTATLSPFQTYLNQLLAGGTATTQQTLGVGSGGSSGLLGGLLGGLGNFAGSEGGSRLIASWLSDRRAKEEIEEIGSVDGFPLYRFKYKGVPGKHIGMMAQDVEERLPEAVGQAGPLKTVDYVAVLEHLLEAA